MAGNVREQIDLPGSAQPSGSPGAAGPRRGLRFLSETPYPPMLGWGLDACDGWARRSRLTELVVRNGDGEGIALDGRDTRPRCHAAPHGSLFYRCTVTRSAGEPNELAAGYGVGYFHLIWDRSEGLSRGMPGGPEVIIEYLSSMLSDVRTGSRVTSVEQQGDGVRVVFEDGDG